MYVCLSVCLLVASVSSAKPDETDRSAVWNVNGLVGPYEPGRLLLRGPDPPVGGHF